MLYWQLTTTLCPGWCIPEDGHAVLAVNDDLVLAGISENGHAVLAVNDDLVSWLVYSGGQNDDFRPLTSTLGGRGMGCRDKYVTS